MVIDGGSCTNLIEKKVVEHFNIPTIDHPLPYQLSWLTNAGSMTVRKQAKVEFSIDDYFDVILCDVSPLEVCHVLLGRPWKFDKKNYT